MRSGPADGAFPFRRKLAVGIGDFGLNFYWQTAGLYLLFFYTDVLHLAPATAGLIYMIALVWDAVLDPVIGLMVDRTSSRHGRYRPYLLYAAPATALGFLALFVAPSAPAASAALVAGATHFAFRTLYALTSVPYAAMTARVTRDAAIRADITGVRMVSAASAAILVATLTLPLATAAGGGRRGWMIVALVYAVIATATLLWCARATRELDLPTLAEPPAPPLGAKLSATARNWPLLLVLAALTIATFTATIFQKCLLYYFKYVVGDASLGGAALGVSAATTAVCIPVFTLIARRWGRRRAWLIGTVPTLVGLVLWRLADGHGTPALLGALAVMAAGSAAYYVSFWAILPDTVEFAEWQSGTRTESFVFGLAMLGQKASLGIGAGLLGVLLAQIGYVADAHQTPQTIAGLKATMFWFPFIGTIVVAALISRYPITPARHAELVADIQARTA